MRTRLEDRALDRRAVLGFNAQRVARGQEVFLTRAHQRGALCIASLPEAYLMERSGAVLKADAPTKYPQAVRRVIETAQFVLHVVEEGGLDPCDAAGAHFGEAASRSCAFSSCMQRSDT